MFRFLIVALIPALVLGQTNVQPCTGGGPLPVEVRVHGCIDPPCDIFQGTSHAMDVDFIAPDQATSLRPHVLATALGLTIEYPLDPAFDHACNYIVGSSCPLAAGDAATYNFLFSVPNGYPPILVLVQLSLLDHFDRVVFCAGIHIHVRVPPNHM